MRIRVDGNIAISSDLHSRYFRGQEQGTSDEIDRERIVSDRDVQRMKKESAIVSKKFTFMTINVICSLLASRLWDAQGSAHLLECLTYHLEKWPWYLEAVVHACLIYSNASFIYSLQEILRA